MKSVWEQYPNLPKLDSRFVLKRIGKIARGEYWGDACGRAFRLLDCIERKVGFVRATIWYYADGEIRQAWQFSDKQEVSIFAVIMEAK